MLLNNTDYVRTNKSVIVTLQCTNQPLGIKYVESQEVAELVFAVRTSMSSSSPKRLARERVAVPSRKKFKCCITLAPIKAIGVSKVPANYLRNFLPVCVGVYNHKIK